MSERMDRLQFYLEPELNAALNQLAGQLHVSKAELIRRGIRHILDNHRGELKDPAYKIIGLFDSSTADIPPDAAVNHDKYIYRIDWEN